MSTRDPKDLHRLFAGRTNAGDLEGLLSLYEDEATLVGPDASTAWSVHTGTMSFTSLSA